MTNSEKARGGSRLQRTAVIRKIDKIARAFHVDTRRIREELIRELKALFEMAQRKALDCPEECWKEKQNWTRIAAYITQVINSIGNTYDLCTIEEDVADLREKIENAPVESEDVANGAESKWRSRSSGGPES